MKGMFFADTFALVEFLEGNAKYVKYFKENQIIVCRLNLMELYYCTLAESSEILAEKYYNLFLQFCVEPCDSTIKQAMKLRLKLKKSGKNISYADALGYQVSIESQAKFLTGDREFKGLPNVEFVK